METYKNDRQACLTHSGETKSKRMKMAQNPITRNFWARKAFCVSKLVRGAKVLPAPSSALNLPDNRRRGRRRELVLHQKLN